jgi:hypothetical protein
MRSTYPMLAFSMLMLVGCTTTPTDKSIDKKEFACIETETASIYNFYVNGGAKVEIKEVDGAEPNDDTPCFAPGEHIIGFKASTQSESVNEYLSYNFEASKKYKLSAQVKGIAFICTFSDITNATEVKLTEIKAKISGAGSSYSRYLDLIPM